jgi:hypothetical protein
MNCDCGACCPQCGHYEGCISGLGRNEINIESKDSE